MFLFLTFIFIFLSLELYINQVYISVFFFVSCVVWPQGTCVLLEAQKEDLARRLSITDGKFASLQEREGRVSGELETATKELDTKTQENEILTRRYPRTFITADVLP